MLKAWKVPRLGIAMSHPEERRVQAFFHRITERNGVDMLPKDPAMLLSFVNMKLRDFYQSLDDLCEDLEVDRQELTDGLGAIGYHYDEEKNRFV